MTSPRRTQRGSFVGKLLIGFTVVVACVIGLPIFLLSWFDGGGKRQTSVAVPAPPVPSGSGGRAIAWGKRAGAAAPPLSLMLRVTDMDQWWGSLRARSGAASPDTNPSQAALELAWPSADSEPAKGPLCNGTGPAFAGCQTVLTRMVIERDAADESVLQAFARKKLDDGKPMPAFWTQPRADDAGAMFAGFACARSPGDGWRRRPAKVSEEEAKLAAQLHCFTTESFWHSLAPTLFGYERHGFIPACDGDGQVCSLTFLYRGRLVTVEPPQRQPANPVQRFQIMVAAWNTLARMEREAATPATPQALLADARVQLESCKAVSAEWLRVAGNNTHNASGAVRPAPDQQSAWRVLRASCLRSAELGTRAAAASPREAAPLIAAASDALWQVERDVDLGQQRHYEALLTALGSAGSAGSAGGTAAMRPLARLLRSISPASAGTQDDPSGNARRERLIAQARPLVLQPPAGSGAAAPELREAAHELREAMLRHLPERELSEDRIAILRAMLDETLARAAAGQPTLPHGNPNDVVDAWSSYLMALWPSGRWAEMHTAARSLQAAWLLTPEPIGASPHSTGAREGFVSSQLVSVYLRAVGAGAGAPDTFALAEAATARIERVFGADSSSAAQVRGMQQQLAQFDPHAKAAARPTPATQRAGGR